MNKSTNFKRHVPGCRKMSAEHKSICRGLRRTFAQSLRMLRHRGLSNPEIWRKLGV
jgi:hypothetical protein